ncbi:3-deoxy-D-manno-octulosonic-acid transferase [Rhodovulum sp. ES.010]|uniref:3-deoxy-D-manno-octulosonic acid transferase n=1 Tax=Rhodovulum sp. ES.010 TaxID=1882821 RepID=UPI00092ADFE2|nr:glycosyltransferase N-terminal domain-containing protein [Rhodovulum sp. ES.010]SIO48310.1 3-deoxy-D-manno-octulosonic-acid transferase [Rhodovulum sp. ES.010]
MARHPDSTRPDGQPPTVWLHAPPPQDRAAAAELLRVLHAERPALRFVVTGPGETGAWLATRPQMPPVELAPAPRDNARATGDFLAKWRPDIAVFYPETLPAGHASHAHARGTALFLIARDLPDSWRNRWRLGSGFNRRLLRRFDRVFAQSRQSAAHLQVLGVAPGQLSPCGPLSEGSAVLGCSEAEREALARLMGGRPAWLAACTEPAEDRVAVAAHASALRQAHRLLLILAPDDPARGPKLARRLMDEGWAVALRSDDEEPEPETQIYVADTEGELGLWLRLAPVSFIGGTLASDAGPDPYHAAALGSAILHGPATGAHPTHYRWLAAAKATRLVRGTQGMTEVVMDLMSPDRAAELARAAWEVSTEGTTATDRVTTRMLEALDLAEAG